MAWNPKVVNRLPRSRRQDEDKLQIRCVKWFRQALPGEVLFMVKNQGIRASRQQAMAYGQKQKQMGLLKGVSDLLWLRDKTYICLEVKKPGGRMSKEQKWFKAKIDKTEIGHHYTFETFKEFQRVISEVTGILVDDLDVLAYRNKHSVDSVDDVHPIDPEVGF
jgi:hypothetical protein